MHFQKPPLGTPLDWSHPFNKDLVLAYALNEGHGDVVPDLSMNGNYGVLKNMAFPPTVASGWNPGRTGVGLNFDGTDDYVDCDDGGGRLTIPNAITISTDIQINTIQASVVVGKANMYRLGVHSDGKIRPILTTAGSVHTGDYGATVLSTDVWYNITMTYDKDGGANNERVYLNGVLDGSWTHTGTINSTVVDVKLGHSSAGSNQFSGCIDQPRIHNRALTAKEIKDYAINPWQVYLDEDDN